MKRLIGAVQRWGKNVGVDERALKEVEKIERGERTVRAPLHPTEARIIAESTVDKDKLQEDIERKYETLDENLRRIEIKVSSIPAKKNPSDRLLPSQESEYRHRNDQPWEYGFYEPPIEKIANNRLTFREALTLMKAHVEIKNHGQGIE
uniref:Uncharacterized protein n=1 Tax=Plectus sambesii TaxID=2011161 RepID=A0A914W2Z3_9BILA